MDYTDKPSDTQETDKRADTRAGISLVGWDRMARWLCLANPRDKVRELPEFLI
jgi:hypothetical protein